MAQPLICLLYTSTNEKIFYPPVKLDTSDSPLAKAGAGTLAYYAPWGDVVMFYGDYNENPSLYELGQIVSGAELVSGMSGTISITAVSYTHLDVYKRQVYGDAPGGRVLLYLPGSA